MNSSKYPAFSLTTPVLLCLTTLRHRRFVEDVINIVGLPSGAHVRLRYNRSYVSSVVFNSLDCGLLQGMRVLVALGASAGADSHTVVPVRAGRIVLAKLQGQLLVLDLALDDFVFESEPLGHFWPEIRHKVSGLPQHFRSDVRAPGMYVNVIHGPITTLLAGRTVEAWEKVANRVLAQDDLLHGEAACIPFLYLLSGLSSPVQRRLDQTGDLVVDSGSRLNFDLHSFTRGKGRILRNPLGEVILDISHPSATFATSRRLRVDSSRDVRRVQLFGSALFRRARGHLSLRVVEFREDARKSEEDCSAGAKTKDERAEVAIARYDFPLIVGRWRPIVASASLALSSTALAWNPPDNGDSLTSTLVVPALVGALAFLALALGFWKDSSG